MSNMCVSCGAKLESTTAVNDDVCTKCKSRKEHNGWVCLLCHKSNAPSNKVCAHCTDKNTKTEALKFEGKTILMG